MKTKKAADGENITYNPDNHELNHQAILHRLVKELVDPFQIERSFIGEIKEVININV